MDALLKSDLFLLEILFILHECQFEDVLCFYASCASPSVRYEISSWKIRLRKPKVLSSTNQNARDGPVAANLKVEQRIAKERGRDHNVRIFYQLRMAAV